jgi:RNA polymerase sigma-70 factor, ECF subfamily
LGTPQSISELARHWTAVQPTVASYISFAIRNFNDAQDVLQDVAATLVETFERYDRTKPFLPWALGVARYKVLVYRRVHATECILGIESLERLAHVYGDMGSQFDLWHEALERCLQKIPDKSQQLLRLRYEKDMKPGQIAGQVKSSVAAVKMNLHRIRHLLRDCVKSHVTRERAAL